MFTAILDTKLIRFYVDNKQKWISVCLAESLSSNTNHTVASVHKMKKKFIPKLQQHQLLKKNNEVKHQIHLNGNHQFGQTIK